MDDDIREALTTFAGLISRQQHGAMDDPDAQDQAMEAFTVLVQSVSRVNRPAQKDEKDKREAKL